MRRLLNIFTLTHSSAPLSSSKLTRDQTSNPTSSTNTTPKGRTRRSSKQKVKNSNFEEHLPPVATMADNRTMVEMLRAPTEGCAKAIVVPPILAEQFKIKHRAARRWLEKEPPRSITTWDDLDRYKDLLHACRHYGFMELHQLDTFYNALNPADQDSLNAAACGNLLEKSPQDALTIIENKSKQTSAVTTAMTAMLKQLQANPPPAPIKAVEEICVTCGGAHPYYQCLAAGGNTFPEFKDNYQGYVLAAACNYNQGVANQMRPPATTQPNQNFHLNELEKIKRMNEVGMKAMQNQIDMVKNELRNEMKTSIQTYLSNQTNEIKNMMASLLQMNTVFTLGSGSLPRNIVANPKGERKAITTRSGLVIDGHTVPTPLKSVTLEVGERIEETYTDPDLAEYTIKVLPPPVQKYKPPSQRDFVVHKRDSPPPNIPYPSRMLKQKQQEKDEVQIKKLWQMFKQLHLNITLAEALVLMPNELKCKALADLGASINLMPLSVWKELGSPKLILTRMTLKLANRAICTPTGIARDVFVPVGKFTFPADFVIVDYESDPRVPLILGRPFLRSAHALIDVHCEEMILCDGDERLTLNMKHDTTSYSNHPQRESLNLINIFNVQSEDFLEMFTDEHALDYSSPPIFDVYEDDLLEVESDADNVYDDPFDSKGEKSKESKLLIDELDLPCDFLPYSEYDSFNSQDFSRVDPLPSTNNEDKVLEGFDPPFYEPLFLKDVPKSKVLLPFSSENEEKVFKPGIYTSEKVKEKQENDKIGTKPNKNEKRGKARKCRSPITVEKAEKRRKYRLNGPKIEILKLY
uniref:Reverse transcriptase domain-containing protein n=1 Tax=Tanacetum cinerariifolium TaxID=118510 RepID=A0A6L2LVM2_TANCI|nr:hypothetical protein [Tanacetum cinerariifolium]